MALINWADVVARYPRVADLGGDSEVVPAWIQPAIAEVEGRLGSGFTTPFSSNNITAKDLCIDMTFCRINESKLSDIADGLRKRVEARMTDLLDGRASMVTSDGMRLTTGGISAWSSTQDYQPVFGMGDVIDSVVDSGMIYDEEQARL